MHDEENAAACLGGLAAIAVSRGQPVRAVRLLSAAESLRETAGVRLPPAERADDERILEKTRAQLGTQAFAAAWDTGRNMTLKDILEEPFMKQQHPRSHSAAILPDGLTAREAEVLRLVAQGWTDAQIAVRLVISPRTVNKHTTTIYSKIGVSSRSGATRYAIEHKLL